MKTPTNRERQRRSFWFILLASLVALLVVSFLGIRLGAVDTPFQQIVEEMRKGSGLVVEYRMPRVAVAILVGMNMAVAGTLMQSVTQNPLAAPDVLGITAGGGLASVILLLVVPNFHPLLLPVCAFLGAVVVGVLVFAMATKYRRVLPDRLVLAGVAISSGLHALMTLLIVKYTPNAASALVWLKGSLYARTWQHVEMLLPWTGIGLLFAVLAFRQLNVFRLGEESMRGLGMNLDRVRLLLLVVAMGLGGSSVAVAGTISFVGLVVPHLSRLLVGSDVRFSLPVSAVLGALLVAVSDVLGRVLIAPNEIPAGILTAILGAPYFLYVLVKRNVTL